MCRPAIEVADIFRQYGSQFRQHQGVQLSHSQWQVMNAMEACRTALLGGHLEQCASCGYQRNAYNSCRNRHCTKCQTLAREQWIDDRKADLLETEYFHVVFTLPAPIAAIALQNKRVVYNILFRATAETLRDIAADSKHLGAAIGFIAILHSWGQNLLNHPHLHCIVPGGGLSADEHSWISCTPGFFLPVRVLSRLFRRLFLEKLQKAYDSNELNFYSDLESLKEPRAFSEYLVPVRKAEWVVYSKPPFGGPEQVLAYLGRYTHRVAISNHRLVSSEGGKISFKWKDYRHKSRQRVMTLEADEFIRRFLLHVLPRGFQKIRHFGFLGNRVRKDKIARCRKLLGCVPPPDKPTEAVNYKDRYEKLTGISLRECPCCKEGEMKIVATWLRRKTKKYFNSS